MPFSADETTLVLVDLQARLMPKIDQGEAVLRHCELLARSARALGIPVLVTEQNPKGLGFTVEPIARWVDHTITKISFDATKEPAFLAAIAANRCKLVLGGCEAHVCLLQTVLGLHRHGFEIEVTADAIGSRRALDREVALVRMQHYGIEVVTSEMVLFEWLQRSDHAGFREILELIR
ncbi:MAG: isochorismatase family protein [Beijerinckiaceae bacterium]